MATIGDWVIGTGSGGAPSGDLRNMLVYAMNVTDVMSMEGYDLWTKKHLPQKTPKKDRKDPRREVGDSIYDFSSGRAKLRESVHSMGDMKKDLSGKMVLLSKDFYYFGRNAVPIPQHLLPIVKERRGHKSKSNAPYVEPFVKWIRKIGGKPNSLYGDPDMWLIEEPGCSWSQSHSKRSKTHPKVRC